MTSERIKLDKKKPRSTKTEPTIKSIPNGSDEVDDIIALIDGAIDGNAPTNPSKQISKQKKEDEFCRC